MEKTRRDDSITILGAAEKETTQQIALLEERLNQIPAAGSGPGVMSHITGRSAIVQAVSTREQARIQSLLAEDLEDAISDGSELLSSAIKKFTETSDRTAKALTTWTKWLAIGTFTLAAATIALVIVEALKK